MLDLQTINQVPVSNGIFKREVSSALVIKPGQTFLFVGEGSKSTVAVYCSGRDSDIKSEWLFDCADGVLINYDICSKQKLSSMSLEEVVKLATDVFSEYGLPPIAYIRKFADFPNDSEYNIQTIVKQPKKESSIKTPAIEVRYDEAGLYALETSKRVLPVRGVIMDESKNYSNFYVSPEEQ